ncbi:MAG TPA: hypothetical protein VFX79_00755 [Candidatus Saccharimonadales bacterium]|nr:hypothetical protein [Candidatus Saccharimonadales bacterium]
MAVRKIEIGEEMRSGELIPRKTTHKEGHAVSVNGLTGGRISVSDALGGVQKRVIDRELEATRAGCPLGDVCQLTVVTPTSDDALPSEAIFSCPRSEEACEAQVERAGENTDRQIAQVRASAAESIGQLGAGR